MAIHDALLTGDGEFTLVALELWELDPDIFVPPPGDDQGFWREQYVVAVGTFSEGETKKYIKRRVSQQTLPCPSVNMHGDTILLEFPEVSTLLVKREADRATHYRLVACSSGVTMASSAITVSEVDDFGNPVIRSQA